MKNIYGFSGFIIALFISIGLIIACGNKKESEVTKEETKKEETKKETTKNETSGNISASSGSI